MQQQDANVAVQLKLQESADAVRKEVNVVVFQDFLKDFFLISLISWISFILGIRAGRQSKAEEIKQKLDKLVKEKQNK
ncbi:hypothetical protein D3C79_1011540 [compost metagenome]